MTVEQTTNINEGSVNLAATVSDGVLDAVRRMQGHLDLTRTSAETAYEVLDELLELTSSTLGFLAGVDAEPDGGCSMRIIVLGGSAFNEEVSQFLDKSSPEWMVFRNPCSVLGAALRSTKPVVCNHFATDPRAWDLPEGHPVIDNFIMIPLAAGGSTVAVAAVANSGQGYEQDRIEALQPVFDAAAAVVVASQLQATRDVASDTRAELDLRHWALLDSIDTPAFRWTLDGVLPLEVNFAYSELLGYRARHEALCSCACRDFFVEKGQCQRLLDLLEKNGSVSNLSVALRRRTGEVILANLNATAYTDSGFIEGTLSVINGSPRN